MEKCVYQIRNLKNEKRYIGATHNIANRWSQHKTLLRQQNHSNALLQDDWNELGKNCFVLDIIEPVRQRQNLKEREKYHIKNRKPEYNISLPANMSQLQEQRTKRAEKIREKMKENKDKSTKNINRFYNDGGILIIYP